MGTRNARASNTLVTSHASEAVADILRRLGKRLVVGTPLGIGKPNALLNALYQRAVEDPTISLDIITALSLNPPRGASDLEERVLRPIRKRVWGDYPRLDYLDALEAQSLPPNVRVVEFYVKSGARLHNPVGQQNYISSNYTHVARDMLSRGVNLLMQAVSLREDEGRRRLSLSSNPDVTLQIVPMLKDVEWPWLAVAQINREMPWFGGDAEVTESDFDIVLDAPSLDHAPFAVPHAPISAIDYAIGLRASALVRDGGTLQVGIGNLGDAACHGLRLRESDNATYRKLLAALQPGPLVEPVGGVDRFGKGLYVASELISNPLFALFEDGIVRRRVYEDATLQRLVNDGADPDHLPPDLYDRLWAMGALDKRLSSAYIEWLQDVGLARTGLVGSGPQLRLPDGHVVDNALDDPEVRAALNRSAIGEGLRHGASMHGAFFIGPADFYRRLQMLDERQRAQVGMTSVAEVNRIFTHYELERLQRQAARFINIAMKVTLLGAAISDQLKDGQVISGVGGQYNFVSMAHQLEDGRSILLLRSTHGEGKTAESNIVWEYAHATIPRHLRDIVITEYGAADLRGKTDRECIEALIAIADSRFQEQLADAARKAGKLPADYRVPDSARNNTPQAIGAAVQGFIDSGALPRLPFGSDLKDREIELIAALGGLKTAGASWGGRLRLLGALLAPAAAEHEAVAFALAHLELTKPANLRERFTVRLVRAAYAMRERS